MNCIIVDDEPLAREAVEMLINETGQLTLAALSTMPPQQPNLSMSTQST